MPKMMLWLKILLGVALVNPPWLAAEQITATTTSTKLVTFDVSVDLAEFQKPFLLTLSSRLIQQSRTTAATVANIRLQGDPRTVVLSHMRYSYYASAHAFEKARRQALLLRIGDKASLFVWEPGTALIKWSLPGFNNLHLEGSHCSGLPIYLYNSKNDHVNVYLQAESGFDPVACHSLW
jgi:hypothetical protein